MKILINCTGKFCYRHGNFQKTEAARGVFKSLTKFTRKHLWRVWCTPGLWSATLLKKRLRQMFFCELCEIFKNTFFASDCFSKYESLYIIATIQLSDKKLSWKCSDNIQEHICIGLQLSRNKFR